MLARRFAGWGQRGWAIYSAVTGVVFLVGFVLTSMAFNQAETLVEFGGLLQRTTITVGWTWLTLLAVHLLRGLSPERPGRISTWIRRALGDPDGARKMNDLAEIRASLTNQGHGLTFVRYTAVLWRVTGVKHTQDSEGHCGP